MSSQTPEREKRSTKKATKERTEKRERVPYNAYSSRMPVPADVYEKYPDRGKHCFRWVNDEEGAVQRRQAAWWEVCTDHNGNQVSIPVGQGKTTSNLQAVLMTCTEEVFAEDQALQNKRNMAFRDSQKKSNQEAGRLEADGGYTPYNDDGSVGLHTKTSSEVIK